MQDTQITIVGNLVDDPELRFTPTGQPVAKFRIASTPRYLDKSTNEWKDGDSLFLTCNVWRQAAENVAEPDPRHAGNRPGRLKQRSYETKEGEKRTVYEVEVDELGPSLRNASAKVTKVTRTKPATDGGQHQGEADPWAKTPGPATRTSRRSSRSRRGTRPRASLPGGCFRTPQERALTPHSEIHYITFISLPCRLAYEMKWYRLVTEPPRALESIMTEQTSTATCKFPGCENAPEPAGAKPGRPPEYCVDPAHNPVAAWRERKRQADAERGVTTSEADVEQPVTMARVTGAEMVRQTRELAGTLAAVD